MEILKCKTAEMCEKELWVYFLAYNLIRLLILIFVMDRAFYASVKFLIGDMGSAF